MATARDYVLTLFGDEWLQLFSGDVAYELPRGVKYLCGQVERAPGTGRLHVQAFVVLSRPQRISGVKRLLSDQSLHAEPRCGSREEARDYTRKEDTRVHPWREFGEWTTQGARTDLLPLKRALEQGVTPAELFRGDDTFFEPAVKYIRGLYAAYLALNPPLHREGLTVLALIGPPGTGKTSSVHTAWGQSLYVVEPPNTFGGAVWWDGYEGEETVLLDDYEGWLPWVQLLRLLDPYPMRVAVKGGFVPLACRRVVITSNKTSAQWHPNHAYAPLERRLTRIYNCGSECWIREK